MRYLAFAIVALVQLVGTASPPTAAAGDSALVLGTSGDRFTVDGEPRFLVFVSYFDALDAAQLEGDLTWIAARADGIRLFPDWWDYDRGRRCATRFSDRTVLVSRPDGTIGIRPDRLTRLRHVLRRAKAAGLLVDLTFSYETVRGASRLEADASGEVCGSSTDLDNRVRLEPYARALGEVAGALATQEFRHVFFDLQNEWNGGWTKLSSTELTALAQAVRRADAERLLTASAYDPKAERLVEAAVAAGLRVVTYHDWPRSRGWQRRVAPAVARVKAALAGVGLVRPVFAGEPPPGTYGGGPAVFRQALDAARTAGAAGWTFHTRAGFRLDSRSFEALLDADARTFLDGLAAERRAAGPEGGPARPLGVD